LERTFFDIEAITDTLYNRLVVLDYPYKVRDEPTKGRTIMRNNVAALVAVNDETFELEGIQLSEEMSAALKAAINEHSEEKKLEIGKALKAALTEQDRQKKHLIADIRNWRHYEKQAKTRLKKMDDTFKFATETGNYVPWLSSLGFDSYSLGISECEWKKRCNEIPKD